MKKKQKERIDFYPTMCTRDLVVVTGGVSLEKLKKRFSYSTGEEMDNFNPDDYHALCASCKDKKTGKPVELIYLIRVGNEITDQAEVADVIAHEAVHAALDLYGHMEAWVDINNQEPFAYLVGYIVSCVYKTYLKK